MAENVISLDYHLVDSLELSQALSVEEVFIPDNHVPIGKVKRVERNDSLVFIWAGNRINIYSKGGQYLGGVGRPGRGPGEYVSISNFSVSDREVLVLDRFVRMLVYDLAGEFQRGEDLPYYAGAGKIFGDRIYLSSAYQDETDKFHVYSLKTLEEEGSFHKIHENEMTYRHFMLQNCFFVAEDNSLLFHECMNNQIYQLYPDRSAVVKSFDFWGKNPPEEVWSKRYDSVADIWNELSAGGYAFGMTCYACGNGNHFLTYLKEGETAFALSDASGRKSTQSDRIYFKGVTRALADGDITMSFNSTEDISFAIPTDALLQPLPEGEDNPVILFVKFK